MASVGNDSTGAHPPISRGEMESLLEPLQSCILRMESVLLELSCALPPKGLETMHRQNLTVDAEQAQPASWNALAKNKLASTVSASDANTYDVQLASAPLASDAHAIDTQDVELIDLASQGQEATLSPQGSRPTLRRSQTATATILQRIEMNKTLHSLSIEQQLDCTDLFATFLEKGLIWWDNIEEPDRTGCIFRLTNSRCFETVSMLAIMANSAMVAFQADWQIKHIGRSEPWVFFMLEISCLAFFLCELILRIAAHGWYFFFNDSMHWNILDTVLVSASLTSVIFDLSVGDEQQGRNVGFMRLIRLFKLARAFRSLRAFKFFRSLSLLLGTFVSSFLSLFWALILLAFLLYIFALIFVMHMAEFLTHAENLDPETQDDILSKFGTLNRSMLSLYMSVTGGEDWARYFEIIWRTGQGHSVLFVFFTFLFIFALFNILTGAVVRQAQEAATRERTDILMAQRKMEEEMRRELRRLCHGMDLNKDGTICMHEFSEWMCNPFVSSYLASLGIRVHDVELFYGTLGARSSQRGSGTHRITVDDFIEECVHMQGTASAFDLQRQLLELRILHHDLNRFSTSCMDRLDHLDHFSTSCINRLDHFEHMVSKCCNSIEVAKQSSKFLSPMDSRRNSGHSLSL